MEKSPRFVSIIVALATIGLAAAVEIPEFLHVCKRNDPNLEGCVKESVEALRPYLTKGVPEYNIPSLEPLLLKELVAAQGGGIKITAKNVKAYGASDFSVTKLKVDVDNLRFVVDVALPNLYVDGMYHIDGKVLLLPIRGSGPMRGNFTTVTGAVKFQGAMQKGPGGEDHMKVTDFRLKISVGKGSIKLDNLFGGEQALGDVVNSAINNNFDAFLKELQPLIEQALSDAFLDIANSIVGQFTLRQLFPDN